MQIPFSKTKANAHEPTKAERCFILGMEHALNILTDRVDCKTAHHLIAKEITTLKLLQAVKRAKRVS